MIEPVIEMIEPMIETYFLGLTWSAMSNFISTHHKQQFDCVTVTSAIFKKACLTYRHMNLHGNKPAESHCLGVSQRAVETFA